MTTVKKAVSQIKAITATNKAIGKIKITVIPNRLKINIQKRILMNKQMSKGKVVRTKRLVTQKESQGKTLIAQVIEKAQGLIITKDPLCVIIPKALQPE